MAMLRKKWTKVKDAVDENAGKTQNSIFTVERESFIWKNNFFLTSICTNECHGVVKDHS